MIHNLGPIAMGITDEMGRKLAAYTRSTTIQITSFNLLVLAFCVVLVSIYYSLKIQTKGRGGQLKSYVYVYLSAAHRINHLHLSGRRFIGANKFQGQINDLFAAALRGAQVQIRTPGRAISQIDKNIGANKSSEGVKFGGSGYNPELCLAPAGLDAIDLTRAGCGDLIATFGFCNSHASKLREMPKSQRGLLSRDIVFAASSEQN